MSRSYRHNPITGTTTAKTEKWYKQIHNRKYRKRLKELLELGDYRYLNPKVYGNPWWGPKDGKTRHNPENYPTVWRK